MARITTAQVEAEITELNNTITTLSAMYATAASKSEQFSYAALLSAKYQDLAQAYKQAALVKVGA